VVANIWYLYEFYLSFSAVMHHTISICHCIGELEQVYNMCIYAFNVTVAFWKLVLCIMLSVVSASLMLAECHEEHLPSAALREIFSRRHSN